MGWTRRIVTLGLVAALGFTLVGCGSKSGGGESKTTEPYKIGAVLSLTGTYAALGTAEKNAIELEVKRINDAGGINGRQLDVIIEDDATDEAKAVSAATKLIEQDGVIGIIGATGTGQTMAMRSELQRASIPQVSMAGGNAVTSKFDKLVFQTPWPNKIVVPFVLQAIKDAGYTKVAVVSDSGGYGKDGHEIIVAEAKNMGLTIVSDQTFNAGDTDMSAQLTNIKKADADALLMWTAGKEAATVVKSATDLGLGLPLFGGSGQARAEFASGSGVAAEGFVFGTGKSLMPSNWPEGSEERKAVQDFADRYKKAYGADADIFAGHAFDAVGIVADALKRAEGDVDSAKLRDLIEQTKDLPGFGGTFTFSATDHNGLTADDLALYKIEGGKWVLAK
ncbi:MAG TPA: ABC transporter substrate-binding protein [Coriobacteriia bacterium]|nr:ABC transporter substrate-binding protein [Coriobacteriia bacterium]